MAVASTFSARVSLLLLSYTLHVLTLNEICLAALRLRVYCPTNGHINEI